LKQLKLTLGFLDAKLAIGDKVKGKVVSASLTLVLSSKFEGVKV
jgi:hypothetical protein